MADVPSNSPASPPPKRFQFGFWTLAEVVAGAAVVFAVVAELRELAFSVLLPAVALLLSAWYIGQSTFRRTALLNVMATGLLLTTCTCYMLPTLALPIEVARRNQCRNNLREITLALQSYHDKYKTLPPAVVEDANGKPMHSWRALILPFLDPPAALAYDYGQPWDSPANAALPTPSVYQCPSCRFAGPGTTNYFYVVGGERDGLERGQSLRGFADVPAETILVVESSTLAAHWNEPRDLTMDEALREINDSAGPSISSCHQMKDLAHVRHAVNIAMADGATHFIRNHADRDTLKALLTIDGGETVDWSKLDGPPDSRPVVAWLIFCTIAYVTFIIWRHWPRRRSAFLS